MRAQHEVGMEPRFSCEISKHEIAITWSAEYGTYTSVIQVNSLYLYRNPNFHPICAIIVVAIHDMCSKEINKGSLTTLHSNIFNVRQVSGGEKYENLISSWNFLEYFLLWKQKMVCSRKRGMVILVSHLLQRCYCDRIFYVKMWYCFVNCEPNYWQQWVSGGL